MIEYIAIKTGFMDGRRYRKGDTFWGEEGMTAHWFIPKGTEEQVHKPELEGSKALPQTYSELCRRGPAPGPQTSPGRRPGRPKKEKTEE